MKRYNITRIGIFIVFLALLLSISLATLREVEISPEVITVFTSIGVGIAGLITDINERDKT